MARAAAGEQSEAIADRIVNAKSLERRCIIMGVT